jgi:ribosomal protein L34
MATEAQKSARLLVQRRTDRFESRHALEESKARLAARLPAAKRAVDFRARWNTDAGRVVLEADFLPTRRAQGVLKATSLVLAALIASSAWVIYGSQESGALRFLLPGFTLLAIFAAPFIVTAMGTNREADEARVLKAIRVALLDEDDKLAPRQKWDDE